MERKKFVLFIKAHCHADSRQGYYMGIHKNILLVQTDSQTNLAKKFRSVEGAVNRVAELRSKGYKIDYYKIYPVTNKR